MQKGTTPNWKRPVRAVFEIEVNEFGFADVNILDALVATGMTQSKAEAKRLVEQKIIWLDNWIEQPNNQTIMENWLLESDFTTVWDRMHKVNLELDKCLLIFPNDMIGIGKTIDDAVAHRIIFQEKSCS